MSKITFVCLSLGLILALTQGSPTGAPLLACEDMIPMHDVEPQVTASPFVTTPASTQITQGGSLRLTLAPVTPAVTFKGFLVIAFDNANPTSGPLGSFSAVSDGKTIDCPGALLQNAATHSLNNTKSSVTVDWNAPEGFVGTVLFKTSYVQEKTLFWVQVPSTLVTVA